MEITTEKFYVLKSQRWEGSPDYLAYEFSDRFGSSEALFSSEEDAILAATETFAAFAERLKHQTTLSTVCWFTSASGRAIEAETGEYPSRPTTSRYTGEFTVDMEGPEYCPEICMTLKTEGILVLEGPQGRSTIGWLPTDDVSYRFTIIPKSITKVSFPKKD